MASGESISTRLVKNYLLDLQDRICQELEIEDSEAVFFEDAWSRDECEEDHDGPALGGGGRTRVLNGGAVFEQAGVNFSHVTGASLPPSATAARPELSGRSFEALGVSLVIHGEPARADQSCQCSIFYRRKRG